MKQKSKLSTVAHVLVTAVFLVLGACAANRPLVSGIRGSTFMGNPVAADRIYVICNLPIEYRTQIAEPLAAKLKTLFAEKWITTAVEIQFINPLALDSGVNFRRAARYGPSAIMLVRMGESSFGSGGSYWNINFDLLDPKGKGVWRGWSSIYRLNSPEEAAEQLARDLIRAIIEAGAIRLPEGQSI